MNSKLLWEFGGRLKTGLSSEAYLGSGTIRVTICLLAALVISCQQISYRSQASSLDRKRYSIHAATGLKEGVHHYSYGLYHWGLFPVYSTYERKYYAKDKHSKEFARKVLVEHGDTLRMEYRHEIRFGEYFKFYLTYIASLIAGQAGRHDLGVVNTFFFLAALFAVLLEFHRCRRPLLGALVAIAISSSEFQAIQMQADNFSYIITAATFALAVMAPFIFDRKLRPAAIVARLFLVSFFIVLCGNVRSTAMSMVLGPPIALILYGRVRFKWRVLLLVAYLTIFSSVYKGFQAYFDHKIEQASEFVEAVGGVPYLGERLNNHPFWHPIWCGMADFDTEYGHRWSDNSAWAAARPRMKERGWKPPPRDKTQGDYYTLCTSPVYEEVMQEVVLEDIRSDPRWYLGIIVTEFNCWESECKSPVHLFRVRPEFDRFRW